MALTFLQYIACNNSPHNTCWKHAVVPEVTLTFSNTMVKAGTSINVTCTAQSYPPAIPTDYQLQHSSGVTVNTTHRTPGGDGVVYPIETVTSEDGGEYECIVTVGSEQLQRLQSDTIRASLTVYYGKSCKVMAMCYIYLCA